MTAMNIITICILICTLACLLCAMRVMGNENDLKEEVIKREIWEEKLEAEIKKRKLQEERIEEIEDFTAKYMAAAVRKIKRLEDKARKEQAETANAKRENI